MNEILKQFHYFQSEINTEIQRVAYERAESCIMRVIFNKMIISIRLLKNEITKRGYNGSH